MPWRTGSDRSALISPEIARAAPDQVLGVHVNALVSASYVGRGAEDPVAGLSQEDAERAAAQGEHWQRERSGYATIRSPQPQTLAYALVDSPVGLLARDLEWFVDYDPGRGVQTPVDPDAVLTDVSICWFTGTAGSSARLHKEAGDAFSGGPRVDTPTAVAVFPGHGAIRALAERSHRVVRWTTFDRRPRRLAAGPDLLLDDLRAFTRELASLRS